MVACEVRLLAGAPRESAIPGRPACGLATRGEAWQGMAWLGQARQGFLRAADDPGATPGTRVSRRGSMWRGGMGLGVTW